MTQITEQANLPPLLGPDEPPAWSQLNGDSSSPLFLLCDHASNRIPAGLDNLGLDQTSLQQHIAYDIGCHALTSRLSELFNCTALLSGYSRLLIDLNRHPGDGSSIPEYSDDILIPGNQQLSREERIRREQTLFWPYHNQVEQIIDQRLARDQQPVLCAIHSFTPVFRGFQRPWHIGVLWDRDQRLSTPLLQRLQQREDICTGDNEPYHARNPVGYTMDVHGEHRGVAHVLLEIRQDLLESDSGIERWAQLIHQELDAVLSEGGFLEPAASQPNG